MEAKPDGVAVMRSFIRSKRREDAEQREKNLAQAREDFRSIVDMIIADFNPDTIYQWGSLVAGDTFQDISDIDVAVAGIADAERFFRLYGRAQELTRFPLHIVQLETIHPTYAGDIVEKGVLIYERPLR
jgi:predicted nucleotidyltransferase